MENNEFERNEIGDYEIPKQKIAAIDTRWWQYTHIFFEESEYYPHFKPFLGIEKYNDDSLNKAREHKDFQEIILYATPKEPPFDFFISYHNWQLALLVKYFKEVFDNDAFEQGYMPSHNFSRIIISKNHYYKILNCINKHNLLPIRDLIVEIISKAQDIYVEDVVWFDNADYKKRIKDINKEINTCKQVLEKLFDNSVPFDSKESKRVELDYINFKFQDGTLRLNDPFLANDILRQFKNHLEHDLPYKNWRKELDRYAVSYKQISEKLKFREKLAVALYNLLTKEKIIKVTDAKPTPNSVTECIADIIELTLIPIGTTGTIHEDKKRIIRHWLERNTLEEKITFYDIPPNKEKLHKYFDPDFINLAPESKRADALNYALYLSERFNLMLMFSDFAHIAQCFLDAVWMMGHQLSDERKNLVHPSPDYTALRKLMEAMKSNIKLNKLTFKIEGDNTEYEFKERLPFYLIERALSINLKDYEEDFEIDIIKGKLIRNSEANHFKPITENRLHLPEEMFIVRFVKSFYDYLLNENPLDENNPFPSEKYYAVIAMMLHHTRFFRHKMFPEHFIIEKVKHWHNLSLAKSGTDRQ